jgi:AcrR family transcriptional regulator
MTETTPEKPGLRERKKLKTRAAIQEHALRLFRERGYDETTVEQIAEAAEVSPSTFFRYFPTKEDVVLYDVLDPVLIEAFRNQPRDLSPLTAFRRTLTSVYMGLPPDEMAATEERAALMRSVPELRARMMDEFVRGIGMMMDGLADRTGRPRDDFALRVFVGAIVGVMLSVLFDDEVFPPGGSVREQMLLFDRGLELLEAGLPI